MEDLNAILQTRLRALLPFVGDRPTIDPDQELRDLGLDSMVAIDLLLDLEQTFQITFPDAQIRAETFRSLRTLEAHIAALMSQD